MNSKIKQIRSITLIFGFISFNWLVYNIYKITFTLLDDVNFSEIGIMVAIGYIFILVFNIIAFICIFRFIQTSKQLKMLSYIALIIGILSLFGFAGEKAMYDEIPREYKMGLEISGEVMALYFSLIIKILFHFIIFILIFKSYSIHQNYDYPDKLKDEEIFIVAQYMGIASGFTGLTLTFYLLTILHSFSFKYWMFIPFYILFFLPYAIAISYWSSMKLKEKIREWYDEKQWHDILKASLATLILSIPGMLLFLLLNPNTIFYWFPFYLFLNLLIFSSSTFYYYKLE